jgi:hypothetical protein
VMVSRSIKIASSGLLTHGIPRYPRFSRVGWRLLSGEAVEYLKSVNG